MASTRRTRRQNRRQKSPTIEISRCDLDLMLDALNWQLRPDGPHLTAAGIPADPVDCGPTVGELLQLEASLRQVCGQPERRG